MMMMRMMLVDDTNSRTVSLSLQVRLSGSAASFPAWCSFSMLEPVQEGVARCGRHGALGGSGWDQGMIQYHIYPKNPSICILNSPTRSKRYPITFTFWDALTVTADNRFVRWIDTPLIFSAMPVWCHGTQRRPRIHRSMFYCRRKSSSHCDKHKYHHRCKNIFQTEGT